MMAFITLNKCKIISLQLAFTLLFLISALLFVAHAEGNRKIDVVMKRGVAASRVLEDAEIVESSDVSSSRSSHAFEIKGKQEKLSPEDIDDDFLVVDYTPARKKSPIHN